MPPIAPSMSGENVEKFHVIGVLISMALYGLYSCLYLQTLYHLKRASARPALLFIGLTTLWIFTTLVTVLRAWCLYQALIPLDGVTTANEYYAQWYQPWESVVTMVIVHATCLLGNTFICWRLYVLWKRDARILIAPVILLTCYVVVATMSVVYAVKSKTSQRYAPIRNGLQLGTAIGALTVNAVLVSLMCWKVWRVSRSVSQLSPVTGSFYERALHILIESGAGYFIVVSASILQKVPGR
ncbi:hypothetical protein FRC03_010226 [Tulasnella sp. 419]|nr:hypothetical protein FRC03_010226 [Tulasnella sp. 419]